MPSELSKQLGDFRTKHKVAPVVQKVSFMFDANRAAGLDVLSLALIARKSLLNLAVLEPALEAFEDLFIGTDKSVNFLSQEELVELSSRIKRLLSYLSGHFTTLDAQQCLEYLIQKYHVHLYNGEDLILFALPYHDTQLFGTLVKLIPFLKNPERANASETRWTFLRNVHKTGSPLSRLALVKMCRSSQPVMTAIIDHLVDSLKYGAFNQPLMSFVNVLLLEVLSEFNSIHYDISIPLFSLCRICFKATQHCTSAFFIGLSVATHIVCVADVRDDALGLLLSRAISVCPADKFHALLMSLGLVAALRRQIPATVAAELAKLSIETLLNGIATSVSSFNSDLDHLVAAIAAHNTDLSAMIEKGIAESKNEAAARAVTKTEVVPEARADSIMEADDASSSSSEDDEEDKKLAEARKVLTSLCNKGTKQERLEAIKKYVSVDGATRHCIRLSAMCDSVESLALTMKHAKKDMGFVPTLVSVVDQFKKSDPRLVLQAVFENVPRIPTGSLTQVGDALGIPDAASLFAVSRKIESEFVLSSKVWQALAVLCANPQNVLGKSALVSKWRSELVPATFLAKENMKDFANTFIEYANNPKVKTVAVTEDEQVEAILGQLVCALTIPNNATKQALTDYVARGLTNISTESRTRIVVEILRNGAPSMIKKLSQVSFGGSLDLELPALTEAVSASVTSGTSIESWTLITALAQSGMSIDAQILMAALDKTQSGPSAAAAWKCVSACTESLLADSESLASCFALIGKTLDQSSASVAAEVAPMLDTLLAISMSGQSVENTLVAPLLKQLIAFVVRTESSISDTLVGTVQSICESFLGTCSDADFGAAWTMLLTVMTELVTRNKTSAMAVQIRCLILLAGLVGRDDVDSELVTSKQLGQVVLGLAELVTTTASLGSELNSWLNLSNTDVELTSAVERIVTQFLLQCTLKKLDKFFRRLLAQDSEPRLALMLRVYATVCEEAGEGATLALLPLISDVMLRTLKSSEQSSKKRKRNMDVVVAALRAATASCIEQVPETSLAELMEAVAELPGCLDDNSVVAETCIAIVKVASSEQIKTFTKQLMQRSRDSSSPFVQECVVRTVLALWRSAGEVMVPAITEVTVFLNELFNSSESEVASVTRQLVKEMDRVTGEDIEGKLGGMEDD